MSTKRQAVAGGEYGANGEWYKGGAFINTVPENPKGQAALRKKPTRKQEIAPYTWEFPPFDSARSLFRLLAGVEIFNRSTCTFSFNDGLLGGFATPEHVQKRKEWIAAFNSGNRWV